MLDWFHSHFIAVKLNAQPVEVSVQQLSPCDPQSEQPFPSLCSVPVEEFRQSGMLGRAVLWVLACVCDSEGHVCIQCVLPCQQHRALLPRREELSFQKVSRAEQKGKSGKPGVQAA